MKSSTDSRAETSPRPSRTSDIVELTNYAQYVTYGRRCATQAEGVPSAPDEPFPCEEVLLYLRQASRAAALACEESRGAETVWFHLETYVDALYAAYAGQVHGLFGAHYRGRCENTLYVTEVTLRRALASYTYLPYLRLLADTHFPEVVSHAEATLWPISTLARTVVPRVSTPA